MSIEAITTYFNETFYYNFDSKIEDSLASDNGAETKKILGSSKLKYTWLTSSVWRYIHALIVMRALVHIAYSANYFTGAAYFIVGHVTGSLYDRKIKLDNEYKEVSKLTDEAILEKYKFSDLVRRDLLSERFKNLTLDEKVQGYLSFRDLYKK